MSNYFFFANAFYHERLNNCLLPSGYLFWKGFFFQNWLFKSYLRRFPNSFRITDKHKDRLRWNRTKYKLEYTYSCLIRFFFNQSLLKNDWHYALTTDNLYWISWQNITPKLFSVILFVWIGLQFLFISTTVTREILMVEKQ